MMAAKARRPRRAIDRDTCFFTQGLEQGAIRIQRCDACGVLRHPPAPICAHCRSFKWSTVDASGRGRIYTFAVHHAPPLPAFPSPHAIVLIDLEEGVRMIGDLIDQPAGSALAIGATVSAVITTDEGDDMLLVRWRLDGTAS